MADTRKLAELGTAVPLAEELARQIDGAAGDLIANVATVGTPDATDEASAITLVNAVKARLNALITALKA